MDTVKAPGLYNKATLKKLGWTSFLLGGVWGGAIVNLIWMAI